MAFLSWFTIFLRFLIPPAEQTTAEEPLLTTTINHDDDDNDTTTTIRVADFGASVFECV